MLAFITSLRHPENAQDYGEVERLLIGSLNSIGQQTDGDWVVIVVGNRAPNAPLPARVRFVEVDFPPPAPAGEHRTGPDAVIWDKGTKLAVGLIAAREYAPDYVMIFDSDDFVHRGLSEFVRGHPEADGWYVATGWRYSQRRNVYRALHAFNDQCGTSHVLQYSIYQVPEHLTIRASQAEIAAGFGARLRTIIGSHMGVVAWARERGVSMHPFPFPAAVHQVDTGQNHSGGRLFGIARPLTAGLADMYGIEPSLGAPATRWSAWGPWALATTPLEFWNRARRWVRRQRYQLPRHLTARDSADDWRQ